MSYLLNCTFFIPPTLRVTASLLTMPQFQALELVLLNRFDLILPLPLSKETVVYLRLLIPHYALLCLPQPPILPTLLISQIRQQYVMIPILLRMHCMVVAGEFAVHVEVGQSQQGFFYRAIAE